MNIESIRKQAEQELKDEEFRKAVDDYKVKLKSKRTLWDLVFPYRLLIIKKEK